MNADTLQLALLLLGSVALGGLLPYTRRWSEHGLHALVALSAGIFLGTVFLHLVPELLAATGRGGSHVGHAHAPRGEGTSPAWAVWGAFALGVVALVWLERRFVHAHVEHADGEDEHAHGDVGRHALAWRATLLGLSIHALLTGLGLAAIAERPGQHWALWSAMALHKITEGFSLGTLLRLAGFRVPRAAAIVVAFSCVAPAGLLLGRLLALELGPFADLLTAFAAGTFLFVAVFELLPEVWHGRERRVARAGLVVLGVVIAGAVPRLDPGTAAAIGWSARQVFVAMAPFLLLGLALAGLLHAFIGPALVRRFVSGEGPAAIARAAIIGAPLPLCSCAVMPLASSLRRSGAGRGPTSAFLIATPETGPDSVLATAALFGPVMTIARPVAAVTSALVVGSAVAAFGKASAESAPGPHDDAHCAHAHDDDCGAGHEHGARDETPARGRFAHGARHALVDVVDDVGVPLLLGVVAAAILGVLVPPAWFASPLLEGAGAYVVLLLVGLPMYLCAAAATPIAAVLVANGVSAGAALVFLLAAPVLNLASIDFLRRTLGLRATAVHVGVLAVVTLALGGALDAFYPAATAAGGALAAPGAEHVPGALQSAAAVVLAALLAASFVRRLQRVGAPPAGSARSLEGNDPSNRSSPPPRTAGVDGS